MSYRELRVTLSAEERAQINVAQECLGRGEWKAAAREIEHMRGATRMNRDVLRLRFGICSAARDWETAFTIADALVSWDESDAKAWVWRSEALHALNRTAEAEARCYGPPCSVFRVSLKSNSVWLDTHRLRKSAGSRHNL